MMRPFPLGVGTKDNPITNNLFSDTYFKGLPKLELMASEIIEKNKIEPIIEKKEDVA